VLASKGLMTTARSSFPPVGGPAFKLARIVSALAYWFHLPGALPPVFRRFCMFRAIVVIGQIAEHPVGPPLRGQSEKLVKLNGG
jgi:hypothetical protein